MIGFDQYKQTRYFAGLNGVRCLAILAVVWHHTGIETLVLFKRGFLGVDLFFVLSGFLIMTLLLRERESTGRISLPHFWARRALRLCPPYYALLLVMSGLYLVQMPDGDALAFFRLLPVNALYLSNLVSGQTGGLSILWSLATEQQFYFVWPLVMLLPARIAMFVLAAFVGLNQLVNFRVGEGVVWQAGLNIMDTTFTPICLGVALAQLLHNERSFRLLAPVLGSPLVLIGATLLIVLIAANPADVVGARRLAIHLCMAAAIASLVLCPRGVAARLLEGRVPARIGVVSYGIYLYHKLGQAAALKAIALLHLPLSPWRFLITAVLGYLLAEMSYRFMEQPILTYARRFRAPSRREAASLRQAET